MNLSTINMIAFFLNLGAVYCGQSGIIGEENSQVSAHHPTLITPARWAFSIWGVIFIAELLFVIWQAVTSAGRSDVVTRGVGPWFALACTLQALWSAAFAKEFLALSAGLLVGVAVSLWLAVVGLAPYKTGFFELLQTPEGWLVHFPIGLHAGWTCAAALVNINIALESQPDSTKFAAFVLSVVVACLAAVIAVVDYSDPLYLCAIVWALAGILEDKEFRNKSLPEDVADGVNEALRGAGVGLLAIGMITILGTCFRGPAIVVDSPYVA